VCAVVFTCALVFLQGCYLCPYDADFVYGVQSTYSFKLGDDVPAKRWVSLGRYNFDQRVHFLDGFLIMNALVHMAQQRAFIMKYRVLLYDQNNRLWATWRGKSKFRANGNMARDFRRNFDYLFLPGYYVVIEYWFSRKMPAGTFFVWHYGYDQREALE
jgi:hypothetical protein